MPTTHPSAPIAWSAVQLDTAAARALVASHAASPVERKETVSLPSVLKRATGRALALHLLHSTAAGQWQIETDPRGKPLALGPTERHVSISHSGLMVVAAVSAIGPIGIDIEGHKPQRRHDRLAEAAFGPSERASVARHGLGTFYRLWTLREAISKAVGIGMAVAADGIDRVPPSLLDGGAPEGVWVAGNDDWILASATLPPDLSLGLAIQVPPGPARSALQARRLDELRIAV